MKSNKIRRYQRLPRREGLKDENVRDKKIMEKASEMKS
jgi:hypothetical protein